MSEQTKENIWMRRQLLLVPRHREERGSLRIHGEWKQGEPTDSPPVMSKMGPAQSLSCTNVSWDARFRKKRRSATSGIHIGLWTNLSPFQPFPLSSFFFVSFIMFSGCVCATLIIVLCMCVDACVCTWIWREEQESKQGGFFNPSLPCLLRLNLESLHWAVLGGH